MSCSWCGHSLPQGGEQRDVLCSRCVEELMRAAGVTRSHIAVVFGEGSAVALSARVAELVTALCRQAERINAMGTGSLEVHWGPERGITIHAREKWE